MTHLARGRMDRGHRVVPFLSPYAAPLGPIYDGLMKIAEEIWAPSNFAVDLVRLSAIVPAVLVPWPAAPAGRLDAAPDSSVGGQPCMFLSMVDCLGGLDLGQPLRHDRRIPRRVSAIRAGQRGPTRRWCKPPRCEPGAARGDSAKEWRRSRAPWWRSPTMARPAASWRAATLSSPSTGEPRSACDSPTPPPRQGRPSDRLRR